MIYIGFALRNPFTKRHEIIVDKAYRASENKTIEICIYKSTCIVEGSFSITSFKQDHAGFSFDFGLFGYTLDFIFYDNRHYDERTN